MKRYRRNGALHVVHRAGIRTPGRKKGHSERGLMEKIKKRRRKGGGGE